MRSYLAGSVNDLMRVGAGFYPLSAFHGSHLFGELNQGLHASLRAALAPG